MEFIPQSQAQSLPHQPKNIYPCLAHIHIIPHSDPKATRRLSTGSFASDEGNALTRVISGGNRRKSSFGTSEHPSSTTSPGTGLGGRRLSFGGNKEAATGGVTGGGQGGIAREDDKDLQGKWYWRVQAGVTETHLVLLPLTQPPNPVLTTPPAPLSHAMPSHSTQASAGTRTEGTGQLEDGGLVGKMKNLFRRSSTVNKDTSETINTAPSANPSANTGVATVNTTTSGSAGLGSGDEERVIDQTAKGEMLPSAKGNEMGATNLNSNAELDYPGMINGSKLGAILIPLQAIDKTKVANGGGKKGEGSWVTVPVLSHFSHFAQSALGETGGVGSNKAESFAKSGYIKFEFDKDWIGAKGECELLYHHLTHAISTLPEGKDRHPHLAQFHLGGKQHSPTLGQTREVGPNDENAVEDDEEYGGPTSTGFRSSGAGHQGTAFGGTTHGAGTGIGGAQTNDLAAGATGDRGIALGHPVVQGGQGGSLSGSSTSGKVGGEY